LKLQQEKDSPRPTIPMDNRANRPTIGAKVLWERRLIEEERRTSMRGKIVTLLTALLFAAAAFVVPVQAAQTTKQDAKQEKVSKPKKAKKTTKKATKKTTKKATKAKAKGKTKAKPKTEKQA
jgi:hypothetical protein